MRRNFINRLKINRVYKKSAEGKGNEKWLL
jgi:hypothetical protein